MQAPSEAHVNGIVEDVAEMHPNFGLQLRGRVRHDFVTQVLPTLLVPNHSKDVAPATSPPAAAPTGHGDICKKQELRLPLSSDSEVHMAERARREASSGSTENRKEKDSEKKASRDFNREHRHKREKQAKSKSKDKGKLKENNGERQAVSSLKEKRKAKKRNREEELGTEKRKRSARPSTPNPSEAKNVAAATPPQKALDGPPKVVLDGPPKVAFGLDDDLEMAFDANTPAWAEDAAPVLNDADMIALNLDEDACFLQGVLSDPWDLEGDAALPLEVSRGAPKQEKVFEVVLKDEACSEGVFSGHAKDTSGSRAKGITPPILENGAGRKALTAGNVAAVRDAATPGWGIRGGNPVPQAADESWFSEFLERFTSSEDNEEHIMTQHEYQRLEGVYSRLRDILDAGMKRFRERQQTLDSAGTAMAQLHAKVDLDKEFVQHAQHIERCEQALSTVHARLSKLQELL
jgi:hypothetical protein